MDLAVTEDQRTALIVAGIWAVVIFATLAAALLSDLKRKYGRLPRGLRWAPRLWTGTKSGTADTMLRLFYPEVWREQYETKRGVK